MEKISSFEDLNIYREAFRLQQEIFILTTKWPREEVYSLIDQIRRSSRSTGANISEAWAKRRYPAHFESKLSDADGELQETIHWLNTAHACSYLSSADYERLKAEYQHLGRMIGSTFMKSSSFTL